MTGTDAPRRGTKRERTRAALIDATWAVIEARGFAGASLEAVAEQAGVTRGAIYSNFASRAELMMAAAAARGLRIDRDLGGPGTLPEKLHRFAEGLADALPGAPGTQRWHAEMLLHIATDPQLKSRIAEGYAGLFDAMADQLRAHGDELAMDAHVLALAIQSLAMGLVYQAILNPQTVPREAVLDAFAALARGAVRA